MKRITSLCFIVFFCFTTKAGFIIGYQGGIWVPGLGNVQSKTFVLEKKYHADFNYNSLFHGLYLGYRIDFEKGWVEASWNNRHNIYTSEYSENGVQYKESFKPKMNALVFCAGYKYKKWGFGGGMDATYFNVKHKNATVENYNNTDWGDAFGKPIMLFPPLTFFMFDIHIERHLTEKLTLKTSYHTGFGDVRFWFNDRLKPSNLTVALLLNLKKAKS